MSDVFLSYLERDSNFACRILEAHQIPINPNKDSELFEVFAYLGNARFEGVPILFGGNTLRLINFGDRVYRATLKKLERSLMAVRCRGYVGLRCYITEDGKVGAYAVLAALPLFMAEVISQNSREVLESGVVLEQSDQYNKDGSKHPLQSLEALGLIRKPGGRSWALQGARTSKNSNGTRLLTKTS